MKKRYTQPAMCVLMLEPYQMIADSTVQITVSDETFDGAGRTKDGGDWNIWE
ncbi:MAG: hypothetical protein IJ767_08480 [Bacteroidaceae bacterium]|nr:hypothetical protein [Bacteroidaceae bacterium]MBR1801505.1 hypothetical protein [Bacteroidaceae bacterium]